MRGYDDTELTHAAVAAYIASGMADVGHRRADRGAALRPALHPAAARALLLRAAIAGLEQPHVRPVLELLRSPGSRAAIASLAGYDAGETGKLLTVQEAFER